MDIPTKVYKYRIWDDIPNDYILTKKTIKISSPDELLADYPECILQIDYSMVDEEYKKKVAKHHAKLFLPYGNRIQRRKKAKELLKIMVIDDPDNRQETRKKSKKLHNDVLGIFCSSYELYDKEIWIKLANNGKGYCVAFHTEKLMQVIDGSMGYIEYYPVGKPPLIEPVSFSEEQSIEKLIKEIYSVPDTYKYEKEFRFVRTNRIKDGSKFVPYKDRDRLIELSENIYSEIILGFDISESDKSEIVNVRNVILPSIPIWVTKIIDNNIEITEII